MTYILKDSQTTDNDFWGNASGRDYLGTSFLASSNWVLHRLELNLSQADPPTGNIVCEIRSDASGLPSNTVLATNTNTVLASSVPAVTADYTPTFDFAGLTIVNGTRYHIVLHGDGPGYGGGTSGIRWRSNTAGVTGETVSEDLDGVGPFGVTSADSQNNFKAYFNDAAGSPSAVLSGTALSSINETDIVAGGKTIIVTLTGTTWILP